MGRHRKTVEERKLEGSFDARRHAPAVDGGATSFQPTVKLSRAARGEWTRIRRVANWLRESDAGILTERCIAWSRLREAEADADARGLLVPGHADHLVLNPSARVANALRDQLQRFDVQLGLTPRSRQGIHAEPQPEDGGMDAVERALCGLDPLPCAGPLKFVRKI
jgi:P27 family predicted phage terminase small subunit